MTACAISCFMTVLLGHAQKLNLRLKAFRSVFEFLPASRFFSFSYLFAAVVDLPVGLLSV